MKKFLISVILVLLLIIGAEIGFLVYRDYVADNAEATTAPTTQVTEVTTVPATVATEAPTTVPTTAATEPTTVPTTQAPTTEVPATATTDAPTEAPTETPTEPENSKTTRYYLSFAGNCTLGTTLSDAKNPAGFHSVVGDDYGFPFRNVQEIFAKDDFTMVNLEGVLADDGDPINKEHTFLGPAAYAKILTEGSVEAVSLANDHTGDFGKEGYKTTKASLDTESVSYVESGKTMIYTTERGLKVGVYAVDGTFYSSKMKDAVSQMKKDGAEIIIAYFHWGSVNSYIPSNTQVRYGHAAVDAGADIVIGTGPHVLQKIESYKNGMICYSLGNFSYGGSKWPKDKDTAIVQLEVIRDEEGKVSLGEFYTIPCNMTSSTSQNNYQPTVLESDHWQFQQILRKLGNSNAKFTGESVGSTTSTTAPTETPATAPTEVPVETTEPSVTQDPDYDSNDVPDINDPEA